MVLKKNIITVFCATLLIFFVNMCSDSPVGSDPFVYPLELGNKWTYSREFSSFNFRPNNPDVDTTELGYKYFAVETAEIIRKEILNDSLETFVLRAIETSDNFSGYRENYINNTKNGLYHYAYSNAGAAGIVLPKNNKIASIQFNGRTFSGMNEFRKFYKNLLFTPANSQADSLYIEDSPLLSIKYPLAKQTSEWIYRERNKPFIIAKKYLGREEIEIASTVYECYKIQWLYDMNNDYVWDNNIQFIDYISNIGLVKRIILFKDFSFSTPENPDAAGYYDSIEEYILTSTNF